MKKHKIMKYIILTIIILIISIVTGIIYRFKYSYSYYINGAFTSLIGVPSKPTDLTYYVVDVDCNNADGIWDYNNWRPVVKNIVGEVSCNINFKTNSSHQTLADLIISKTGQGYYDSTKGIYLWQITNETINDIHLGYRYVGMYPDNYVYLNDELWRIVGVFDDSVHGVVGKNLVKLVKNAEIKSEIAPNEPTSFNGTITQYLNLYYNSINDRTKSYIPYSKTGFSNEYDKCLLENVKWAVNGQHDITNSWFIDGVNNFYYGDSFKYRNNNYYENYIGVLFLSDYALAFPSYIYNRVDYIKDTSFSEVTYNDIPSMYYNWLYLLSDKNVIFTPVPGVNYGYAVSDILLTDNGMSYTDNYTQFRKTKIYPAVYLKSEVFARSGTGTRKDPYILELNK